MISGKGTKNFYAESLRDLVLAMAVLSRAYTPKETYIKSIRRMGHHSSCHRMGSLQRGDRFQLRREGRPLPCISVPGYFSDTEGRSLAPGKKYAGGAEDRRTPPGYGYRQRV